jgi:DNA-binding response OmpR family regulator
MENKLRIALVEDDPDQAEILTILLTDAGHRCTHFANARQFMRNITHESYDLVMLDWVLPDLGGDEVVKWMRSELDWYVPVLFITIRDSEEDIIHGLACGADDYMVKPIRPRELMARLEALSRRTATTTATNKPLEVENFVFDPNSKVASRDGESIEMTHKEFELAYFLFRNMGRIMSRGYLLENIWGKNSDLNTRTVDTHISRIRTKLGLNKELGWKLGAIYQHGYRLEKWSSDGDTLDNIIHPGI